MKSNSFNYFWIGSIIVTLIYSAIFIPNIRWDKNNTINSIIYTILQLICFFSSSEIFLKAMLVLFHKKKEIKCTNKLYNISVIINYNLKAVDRESVDECLKNMFKSFLVNLSRNHTMVLISATNNIEILEYEATQFLTIKNKIYEILLQKAHIYTEHKNKTCDTTIDIDNINYDNIIWNQFDVNDLKNNSIKICKCIIDNFLYIRRNSTVLKKCGQYQDLITWSEGYKYGYTYKNPILYGKYIRLDEQLFNDTPASLKIFNKQFKYTLVLDGDSLISHGTVFKLVDIAENNQYYHIIQPQIEFYNNNNIFKKIQNIVQNNTNIINGYVTSFMDHSNFYGKGFIRNSEYLKRCIGTPDNIIEYVPANCISHDTFESMILPTLYCDKVTIKEESPSNLISWNIRETRWNYGDIIIAKHIYPTIFCRRTPKYSKNAFNLTFNQSYIALSSIRIIITKPVLLLFIVYSNFVYMHYPYIPMIYMLVTLLLTPLLINIKISNIFKSFIIFFSLILQFTPEPLIGSYRLLKVIYKLLMNNNKWTPSKTIENNITKKGIVKMSLYYYGIPSAISIVLIFILNNIK